jgi:large subunit ribosomal protein L10
MPNLINTCLYAELESDLEQHEGGVFVDFTGISVAEVNELRGKFAQKNVRFRILKNTIAHRVFAKHDIDVTGVVKGPTGYAYGDVEQAISAAKVLEDLLKANAKSKLKIRGAVFEKTVLDSKDAAALAKLPDRQTMRAMIATATIAPARGLAASVNAVLSGLARCIDQKIQKAGGEPAAS